MSEYIVLPDIDWRKQESSFRYDGTLRDIAIADTAIEHWQLVLDLVRKSHADAVFSRGGIVGPLPKDANDIFRGEVRQSLAFSILDVMMTCYFFSPDEIEFSFQPGDVSEQSLSRVLQFIVDIGEVTQKMSVMSPENLHELPIFKYSPHTRRLEWVPDRFNRREKTEAPEPG